LDAAPGDTAYGISALPADKRRGITFNALDAAPEPAYGISTLPAGRRRGITLNGLDRAAAPDLEAGISASGVDRVKRGIAVTGLDRAGSPPDPAFGITALPVDRRDADGADSPPDPAFGISVLPVDRRETDPADSPPAPDVLAMVAVDKKITPGMRRARDRVGRGITATAVDRVAPPASDDGIQGSG
jgi:hypothetical protein